MAKGNIQRGSNNKPKLTIKEKQAKKKEKAGVVVPVTVPKK
jgi:hypothetical protein